MMSSVSSSGRHRRCISTSVRWHFFSKHNLFYLKKTEFLSHLHPKDLQRHKHCIMFRYKGFMDWVHDTEGCYKSSVDNIHVDMQLSMRSWNKSQSRVCVCVFVFM